MRQETGPKGEDRRSNSTRKNNQRADRKMESNDSPEIPDRGKKSEAPSLPLKVDKVFEGIPGQV